MSRNPFGFPRHARPLAPLRKVTGHSAITTDAGATIPRSRLECGHLLHPATDSYGTRRPERRRCWKCRRSLPPDTEDTCNPAP